MLFTVLVIKPTAWFSNNASHMRDDEIEFALATRVKKCSMGLKYFPKRILPPRTLRTLPLKCYDLEIDLGDNFLSSWCVLVD